MPSDPATAAGEVVRLVRARPASLGPGRLVCVDGPAGSGKTTLAAAIAELAPEARVVHTDELLGGWAGLPGLAPSVHALLRPLSEGRVGRWRRWDWHADGWADWRRVEPGGLLVLEGTGCWAPAHADLVGCLVWVEAPSDARLQRGLARDGEQMRPQWEQWRLDEAALFAGHDTRSHADVLVDTGTVTGV